MSALSKPRVLLIEDTVPLAKLYVEFLRGEPCDVVHVTRGQEALAQAEERAPDAVILDLKLPDMDGLDVLRLLRERDPGVSIVIITAHGSIDIAVEAMRLGAFDFIVKPFNADRLNLTLRNALERRTLTRMVEGYRKDLDRDRFYGFIGSSPEMQAVYRTIESVAASRANVFITGESGAGKEVAAQAIHRASPRRSQAFIALNCAAIPKDLLESEIFGHVAGSFTGASGDRPGAAMLANGGTLFLDEICEMPFELQSKLLRFVQTGAVVPVGSGQETRVDVHSSPPATAIPWRRSRPGDSARISITAFTSSRWPCRRCAIGARTWSKSPGSSWPTTPRKRENLWSASRQRLRRGCAPMIGPATSGNCKMSCATSWCFRTGRK